MRLTAANGTFRNLGACWTHCQRRATVEGYEVDRVFPAIGQRIMLLNARMVFYEKGTHTTMLLAFEDITERRVERSSGLAAGKRYAAGRNAAPRRQ